MRMVTIYRVPGRENEEIKMLDLQRFNAEL